MTTSAKSGEIERKWYVVDASEHRLGRLATRVANVLRGKHKAIFTPHVDTGDFVVVINASSVQLTGDKKNRKHYHSYSGYPGGLRSVDLGTVLETNAEHVITHAVRGMLPKNRLSRDVICKLKVYSGAEHPHKSQNPKPLPF